MKKHLKAHDWHHRFFTEQESMFLTMAFFAMLWADLLVSIFTSEEPMK